MQEPAVRPVPGIMTGAEKPVSLTFFVLDGIIIPVRAFFQPPFPLDPLGTVRQLYFMNLPFIPEEHRRIIGDRRGDLDGGSIEQAQ